VAERDLAWAQVQAVENVLTRTEWNDWPGAPRFLERMQTALDRVAGSGRPVFHHPDGRSCVQTEDGNWFVPLDAGGEGFYCEREHAMDCPQTRFPDGTHCGEYGWHAPDCPARKS
jgi:hypothetical protein